MSSSKSRGSNQPSNNRHDRTTDRNEPSQHQTPPGLVHCETYKREREISRAGDGKKTEQKSRETKGDKSSSRRHDTKSHRSRDSDTKSHKSHDSDTKSHRSHDSDTKSHRSHDSDTKSHRSHDSDTKSHRSHDSDTKSHRSHDSDTKSHRTHDHDTKGHRSHGTIKSQRSNDDDTRGHDNRNERNRDQGTTGHRNQGNNQRSNTHGTVQRNHSHDGTVDHNQQNTHETARRTRSHGEKNSSQGHEGQQKGNTDAPRESNSNRRRDLRQKIARRGVALPVTTSDIAYIRGRLRIVTDPSVRGPEYVSQQSLLASIDNLERTSKHERSSRKKTQKDSTPNKSRSTLDVLSQFEPELTAKIETILGRMTLELDGSRNVYKKSTKFQRPEPATQLVCGCCYDNVKSDPVQCSEGHVFCANCLQLYAREVVYGQSRPPLKCMTGDCDVIFPYSQIKKALSTGELANYDERLQEEEILMAGILKEMVRCPKCDFPAIPDRNLMEFDCPECKHKSCVNCKKDWAKHAGVTCEQLNDDKHVTKVRVTYEERMTEVAVRTCATCNAQFTKHEGCNHMTCRCGAQMCYICRAPVSGYSHFCMHTLEPGKGCTKCTKCNLWTNRAEDEQRAIKELGDEAHRKLKHISKEK